MTSMRCSQPPQTHNTKLNLNRQQAREELNNSRNPKLHTWQSARSLRFAGSIRRIRALHLSGPPTGRSPLAGRRGRSPVAVGVAARRWPSTFVAGRSPVAGQTVEVPLPSRAPTVRRPPPTAPSHTSDRPWVSPHWPVVRGRARCEVHVVRRHYTCSWPPRLGLPTPRSSSCHSMSLAARPSRPSALALLVWPAARRGPCALVFFWSGCRPSASGHVSIRSTDIIPPSLRRRLRRRGRNPVRRRPPLSPVLRRRRRLEVLLN